MKQSQKKKLAVLLITAMLFTLLPAGAFAAEEGNTVTELDITQGNITISETTDKVSYIIKGDGKETSNSIVVTGGVQNITLDNVVINSGGSAFALQNNADVTLTLAGNNTLQGGWANAGIHVPAGTTLTIQGEGNLTANGGSSGNNTGASIGGAGIGGDGYAGNFGDITLQGSGIINAKGGARSAGIGGGGHYVQETRRGNITINSGTINANGGKYGAGIGGDSDSTNYITITITGGNVTANGTDGAGIGGGYNANNTNGVISISGGTVTATGGAGSAGIGGGNNGAGGSITVSDGTVTATGGGAGIGGGNNGAGGVIVISDSKVTATGGKYAAGIGGGAMGGGGTILISGSTVSANGGSNAIGGGYSAQGQWDGIVTGVTGMANTVHGNPTLPADFTIPAGQTITIAENQTLTIPEGKTLTNDGKIRNYGTIVGNVSGNPALVRAEKPTVDSIGIDYKTETIPNDGDRLEVNTAQDFSGTAISSGSSISAYIGKTIYVRVKETDTNLESLPLAVELAARPAAPANLQSKPTSFAGESDGSISGVNATMEYKADVEDAAWTDCEDTEITGLSAGTYLVRVKVTASSFASEPATVVVAAGAERICQLHMKDITFPSAKQGETVAEQKIFITNTGNSDANIESLTVNDADKFVLFDSGDKVVEAGTTLSSYTIQPKADLPVGTHIATLTLEYDGNATTTSAVSFTVTKSEKPSRPSTGGSGGFSGVYNYPVKAEDVDGATVSFDKSNAVAGEKVVITVTPDAGKRVDEVIVTDEDNEVIAVTKVGDNKYSFIMPEGAVKVAVTTEKADYDTRVVLQIGNRNVVNDNQTFTNDVAPVIVDNRTMVPIRVITEALGGAADWNEATRTVTLRIDGKILRMTIDQTITGFDAAPVIINSRTYVPIRYVAEALGANVEWLADTQQIIIEK